MAAITVRDVTKAFRKHHRRKHFLTLKSTLIRDLWEDTRPEDLFWALNGVSLEVPRGRTTGVIGANGSGKSTLLKIIAGILKPTAGTVEINGRLSALIELGAGFHPEISGRENIYINGIMLGLSKREIHDRFQDIVNFSELEEFIDNPVKTYSSGMYMRLGFSVAVHVNPEILLIDEVLAVGDQSFIYKCLDRIDDFRRRGKSILMVTHNLTAVEKLCDDAVWIRNGRVMETGRPRKVVDSYLLSVSQKEEEQAATQHEAVEAALAALAPVSEQTAATVSDIQGQTAASEEKRWGNHDIEITRIDLLDQAGQQRFVYQSGEPARIRIWFKARKPVDTPVFGVGIYHSSGVWCYGSNTDIEGLEIEQVEGEGWADIVFDRLDLIEGTYFLDFAVHALDGTPYDYLSHLYSIQIRSAIKDYGVFRPPHRWEFSAGVAARALTEDQNDDGGPARS